MQSEKTTAVESLLGVLSLAPMSGYEMRQFMERSTANFWSESFGQIYPALKTMLADGFVALKEPQSEGHPAKKVYRITEAGRERLRAWLGVPARPSVNRNELLLKVFFGEHADAGRMERQVNAFREQYVLDLARYEGMQESLEREHAGHPGIPFWRMTLRYGIAEATALISWADETLRELEELGSGRNS